MEPPAAQPPVRKAITGRVTDAGGRPVEGAMVAIASSDRPHRDMAARSGPDGSFRLSGLEPGSYVIEAHHAGISARADAALADGDAGDPAVELRLG